MYNILVQQSRERGGVREREKQRETERGETIQII